MMKKLLFTIAAVCFVAAASSTAHGKLVQYTLLEKIENSDLIVLAKFVESKGTFTVSKGTADETESVRYGLYSIVEVLKGKYSRKTLLIDYKKTNREYEPFICRPVARPEKDETVILFLKKGEIIFEGFQGKISVEGDEVFAYKEAIRKSLGLDALAGKEKVLATIKMLDDSDSLLQDGLLRELYKIDNTAYGTEIADLLQHKDATVRQGAMRALNGTKEKKIIPLLIAALKDPDPTVRVEAATVLWPIEDERITPALMEVFNDENAQVKRNAVFALSRRSSREAIPLYLKALKDKDPLVRSFGVNAFEWVNDVNVIPELLSALKDENADVRRSAIRVLYMYIRIGLIKPTNEITRPVNLLLSDEDPSVKNEASYFFSEVDWKKKTMKETKKR